MVQNSSSGTSYSGTSGSTNSSVEPSSSTLAKIFDGIIKANAMTTVIMATVILAVIYFPGASAIEYPPYASAAKIHNIHYLLVPVVIVALRKIAASKVCTPIYCLCVLCLSARITLLLCANDQPRRWITNKLRIYGYCSVCCLL